MTTPEGLSTSDTFATWGDLFEVAVKRGCLDLLLSRGLLSDEPHLAPWAATQVADLTAHLHGQLGVTDPASRERHARALQHLLLQGWGLGWTVLRGALDRLGTRTRDLQTRVLYCPLSLPVRPSPEPNMRAHEELWRALHLPGVPDAAWLNRGQPARADFLLWLVSEEGHQHVFVLEFSLNAWPEVRDFRDPEPHLEELLAHARRLESRGIFTQVGATLTSERFAFSEGIVSHLAAFTTQDKPLYKLAQASAYATAFLRNLHERGIPVQPATAHAIAITNTGVEALEAEFSEHPGPRWELMRALGEAYPRVPHPRDDDREALDREIEAVQGQIVRALPDALRDVVDEALVETSPARGLSLSLRERVEGYANPAEPMSLDRLLAGVEETPAVCALLDAEHPRAVLGAACQDRPTVTLRDVHTAALRRAIEHAPRGKLTVVTAEGMPGIGKTYSVRECLQALSEGFLWLYTSPRLVINQEVLRDITVRGDKREESASGVVALTTNSRLVGGAREWWRNHGSASSTRWIDAAVLCLGADLAARPEGSILFVDDEQAEEIDAAYAASYLRKRNLDEDTDEMRQVQAAGVLRTLAGAARDVLRLNPDVNRLVLSASVQGFRYLGKPDSRGSARTTVGSLSSLFRERAGTPAAAFERLEFARRIPTVVVMVDEIAGDGAGAPFVHELGAWLHRELVEPFETLGRPSPFRVVLVLADASLANDEVLRSYLEHDSGAPEKVIVSPSTASPSSVGESGVSQSSDSASRRAVPFRVTAGELWIGGRRYQALHVMADGFPARTLTVDYHLRLTPVVRDGGSSVSAGEKSARALIAQQQGDRIRHLSVQSVFDVLSTLPLDQQAIFFAQDKLLLRDVRRALLQPEAPQPEGLPLIETHGLRLVSDEIGLLDSSVSDKERKRLTRPDVRDRQRVFLMTSSGARGVSFPRAATIVALVPRFSVESGFMEIAQLVYRGRGGAGGDFLDRRLVMLLQDFVVAGEPTPNGSTAIDDRQWLRRTLDLLSALLLLRATLLTRVSGDAGLRNQSAAVVPVGRIGVDEVTSSLSQAVRPFLHETGVYLREATDQELTGVVRNAEAGVTKLFADLTQLAKLPKQRESVVQRGFVDRLTRQVTAEHARLLSRDDPPSLPPHVYATGVVWLESWADLKVEEVLAFRGQTEAEVREIQALRSRLHRIGQEYGRLPKALTKAARDLESVLSRPEGLRARGFQVKRHAESAGLWLCVPLDYLAFVYVEGEHGLEVRPVEVDTQPLWHEALARVVSASAQLLAVDPVIPRYRACPFLTFQTNGEPTGLERAFDGRYFMASTELNLLNTILFVG